LGGGAYFYDAELLGPKVFLADFGGTDLKIIINGKEEKVLPNEYKKQMEAEGGSSNAEWGEFTKKLDIELNKIKEEYNNRYKEYKPCIRAGSIIKSGKEIGKKIMTYAKTKMEELLPAGQKVNFIVEDAIQDIGNRMAKANEETKSSRVVILGGPIGYLVEKNYPKTEGKGDYSWIGKAENIHCLLTRLNSKQKEKLKAYGIFFDTLFKGDPNFKKLVEAVQAESNTEQMLIGPTGSNPTISFLNKESKKLSVFECSSETLPITARNNGTKIDYTYNNALSPSNSGCLAQPVEEGEAVPAAGSALGATSEGAAAADPGAAPGATAAAEEAAPPSASVGEWWDMDPREFGKARRAAAKAANPGGSSGGARRRRNRKSRKNKAKKSRKARSRSGNSARKSRRGRGRGRRTRRN
jgi:hypothetical protein